MAHTHIYLAAQFEQVGQWRATFQIEVRILSAKVSRLTFDGSRPGVQRGAKEAPTVTAKGKAFLN